MSEPTVSRRVQSSMCRPVKLPLLVQVAAPVREHAVTVIRQLITTAEFPPGARLIERELCEVVGASRSPVREALRQLEAEGLVKVLPNRGPVVAEVSLEEADEIYQVRAVLEGLAGRLFTKNRDQAELRALRTSLGELRKATELGAPGKALAAKEMFYGCLLTGAHNAIVLDTLQSLHGRIALLRAVSMASNGRLAEAYQEVAAIVAAIEAGDAHEAERLCTQHVLNARMTAMRQLRRAEHADGADLE